MLGANPQALSDRVAGLLIRPASMLPVLSHFQAMPALKPSLLVVMVFMYTCKDILFRVQASKDATMDSQAGLWVDCNMGCLSYIDIYDKRRLARMTDAYSC